ELISSVFAATSSARTITVKNHHDPAYARLQGNSLVGYLLADDDGAAALPGVQPNLAPRRVIRAGHSATLVVRVTEIHDERQVAQIDVVIDLLVPGEVSRHECGDNLEIIDGRRARAHVQIARTCLRREPRAVLAQLKCAREVEDVLVVNPRGTLQQGE